jgi:hypothetical protein
MGHEVTKAGLLIHVVIVVNMLDLTQRKKSLVES